MSKCKICGARIAEGEAVCPSCGAKVADGTARQNTIASTSMIKAVCPSCGAEVIGEHRFCDKCGANLKEAAGQSNPAPAPKKRRCPSCGSILQANSAFCPDCGQELAARSNTKTEPAQQTFQAANASTPAARTNSTGNARKLRISFMPENITESTVYFDNVQDFCSSPEVHSMSGLPTLAVDGELTEDELDSIADLVAEGRRVKAFDFSTCTNALKLKQEQFFEKELFRRCERLKTVRLPGGRIFTNSSQNEKSEEERLIEAFVTGKIHGDSSSTACEHYKKAFRKFQEDGGLSFNRATWLFSFFHLLYRRSILGAVLAFFAVWVLIPAVVKILLGTQLPYKLESLITQLFFGFAGDRFIYSRYRKLCSNARFLYPSDEKARIELVARNGGPSIKSLLLGTGIFLLILAIYVAAQQNQAYYYY